MSNINVNEPIDFNTVNTGLGTIATDMYSFINNLLSNPIVIIILIVVTLVYILLFVYLGENQTFIPIATSSSQSETNSGVNAITIILIAIFIILVIINGLQYFFGVDIVASLKNILTGNPELNIIVDTTNLSQPINFVDPNLANPNSNIDNINLTLPQIKLKRQVFNIPENDYVYSDAKALCSAYGARLATYQELEDVYNKGGEWCNYGWSDDQMALFPTQQKTYDNLQKIEGHENDCGRPGVNGGYMKNPELKFGVNCYGYKPRMTPQEEELMATRPIYPKTEKDMAIENRVNYWKDKLTEILVSPFNHERWSKL
jgi:hypothetical protein